MPSLEISHSIFPRKRFEEIYPFTKNCSNLSCGNNVRSKEIILWFQLHSEDICVLTLKRENINFSILERAVLKTFSAAISALIIPDEKQGIKASLRIASRYSIENILVTRFIRGSTRAGTFWTQALIISLLQELSFKRYESERCSSGFIFLADYPTYIKNFNSQTYKFYEFKKPINLSENFYDQPASYRYVEGKNSFYVVDNWQKVYGILRCIEPSKFSFIERSANKHIASLIDTRYCKAWAAYLGNNNDLNLIKSNDKHLKWVNNHWHIVDRSHIYSLLENQGVKNSEIESIISAIFAISDLRFGTVILIPDDENKLPSVSGQIDETDLGYALHETIKNNKFSQLMDAGAVIGILTSDGLTTIAKDGTVVASGQIITTSMKECSLITGGGRTQAAISASFFGISIKVSEDGPITIFQNGKELIKYIY